MPVGLIFLPLMLFILMDTIFISSDVTEFCGGLYASERNSNWFLVSILIANLEKDVDVLFV